MTRGKFYQCSHSSIINVPIRDQCGGKSRESTSAGRSNRTFFSSREMVGHASVIGNNTTLRKESLAALSSLGFCDPKPRIDPHKYHGVAARMRTSLAIAGKVHVHVHLRRGSLVSIAFLKTLRLQEPKTPKKEQKESLIPINKVAGCSRVSRCALFVVVLLT